MFLTTIISEMVFFASYYKTASNDLRFLVELGKSSYNAFKTGVEIAAGCRWKPTRFLKKSTGLTSDLGKKADSILLQSVKYFVNTIHKITVSAYFHEETFLSLCHIDHWMNTYHWYSFQSSSFVINIICPTSLAELDLLKIY